MEEDSDGADGGGLGRTEPGGGPGGGEGPSMRRARPRAARAGWGRRVPQHRSNGGCPGPAGRLCSAWRRAGRAARRRRAARPFGPPFGRSPSPRRPSLDGTPRGLRSEGARPGPMSGTDRAGSGRPLAAPRLTTPPRPPGHHPALRGPVCHRSRIGRPAAVLTRSI